MSHQHHGQEADWQSGFCDCQGHCLEAFCCPCLVVGKTDHLLKETDEEIRRNPNGKPEASGVWCWGLCLATCFTGFGYHLLICIQRGEVRKKAGMESSCCGDFLKTFCCPCCSMIQQYKQLEHRRATVVNTVNSQYKAPPRMQHP